MTPTPPVRLQNQRSIDARIRSSRSVRIVILLGSFPSQILKGSKNPNGWLRMMDGDGMENGKCLK